MMVRLEVEADREHEALELCLGAGQLSHDPVLASLATGLTNRCLVEVVRRAEDGVPDHEA